MSTASANNISWSMSRVYALGGLFTLPNRNSSYRRMTHEFGLVFVLQAVILVASSLAANAAFLVNNISHEADGGLGDNTVENSGNTITGWEFASSSSAGFAGFKTFDAADVPSNRDGDWTLSLNNTSIETAAAGRGAVIAGAEYVLVALGGNFSGTSEQSNIQRLGIDWFDFGGSGLSYSALDFTPILRATNTAHLAEILVTGLAPVGAVSAGISMDITGDWVLMDDFSLTVVPEPGTALLVWGGAGPPSLRDLIDCMRWVPASRSHGLRGFGPGETRSRRLALGSCFRTPDAFTSPSWLRVHARPATAGDLYRLGVHGSIGSGVLCRKHS